MKPLAAIPTVRFAHGYLRIIDQTLLPSRYEIISLGTVDAVCEAIASLRVRGAPAIGVAGAYGLLVAVEESSDQPGDPVFDSAIDDDGNQRVGFANPPADADARSLQDVLDRAAERIVATRPT